MESANLLAAGFLAVAAGFGLGALFVLQSSSSSFIQSATSSSELPSTAVATFNLIFGISVAFDALTFTVKRRILETEYLNLNSPSLPCNSVSFTLYLNVYAASYHAHSMHFLLRWQLLEWLWSPLPLLHRGLSLLLSSPAPASATQSISLSLPPTSLSTWVEASNWLCLSSFPASTSRRILQCLPHLMLFNKQTPMIVLETSLKGTRQQLLLLILPIFAEVIAPPARPFPPAKHKTNACFLVTVVS